MSRAGKKRAAGGRRDPEDALCCCEYINQKGERSHLAACLCDCEDLDEACDRWMTCKSLQPEVVARAVETASDRFRVPWIRGARRVDLSVLPPLVVLPVSLHLAAWHPLLGALLLGALPVLVLWYYRLTHRRGGRTLLFLSLALCSLGFMYYTFVQEVLLKGHIGRGHFSAITGGLLLTLLLLAKAKRDPGYLHPQGAAGGKRAAANGIRTPDNSSRGGHCEILQETGNVLIEKNWCKICQIPRPPRSGHCRICERCVRRMDHHCVWINNCIGARNHKFFILLLVVFQCTSIYGMTVTLGAVCRSRSVFGALFYCPGVYANYSTSFAFTCVWYCAIVTAGTGYVLLIQLLNISYNVTEREARVALREKTGRRVLGGLVVDTGTFSRGFFQNWFQFLSAERAEQELSAIV